MGYVKIADGIWSFLGLALVWVVGEDRLEVRDYVFYGGFAVLIEEVKDNDDGQLNKGLFTFRMKAMTERVRTNDEVPDDPLLRYSVDDQVTPQYTSHMKSTSQVATNK